MTRAIPAIVESSLKQQIADVRAAVTALRDAEVKERKADELAAGAREQAAKRRLELGRALVEARSRWPRSGPNARGWGEFLEREGIEERTARRYMDLAGYRDDGPREEQPDPPAATEHGAPGAARSEFSDSGPIVSENSRAEFSDSRPFVSENSAPDPEPVLAPPEPVIDRDTWCTPRWITEAIGEFDLDPCSNERSTVKAIYSYQLARGEDGLKLGTSKWIDGRSTRVFVNPPYSDVMPWIKAFAHARFCFLLKLDPSTKWFAELIAHTALVLIPRGTRIQFEAPPGVPADKSQANPFPHALFFAREVDATPEIRALCFTWRIEHDTAAEPTVDGVAMTGTVLCRGYDQDASIRRFWSGKRWVVDPSDAELYQGTKWHAVYFRLSDSNTTDHAITGVHNYGLEDETSYVPRSL